MRVLFVISPAKTHLYSVTPLAWAMRTAGHEVRVASQVEPTLLSLDDIAATGLHGVSIGPPASLPTIVDDAISKWDMSNAPPYVPGQQSVQEDYAKDDPLAELTMLVEHAYPTFGPDSVIDDFVRLTRSWKPDLVVWDGTVLPYVGPIGALACGAAHARIMFGTDAFVQLRDAARRQRPDLDPVRDGMGPVLDRYGLDYTDDLPVGQWTINSMPPWTWRPAGMSYLDMRPIAFNGPHPVPEWVYEPAPRRRVCISLGTSAQLTGSGASAADLLEAVADLDVDVIATLDRNQLAGVAAVPDNVHAVDFVPLTALLGSCAAIVHHGGSGTVTSALENAVPQLIVPSDLGGQKWWAPVAHANGIEARGAGHYVCDTPQLTGAILRDHLVKVLQDPSYAENAAELRTELFSVPSPNDVVPEIVRLTEEYRPR
ncbi:glycosyl transferase, UDP-glucuronosyltransferase [Saccharomonospora marina XMU15]|uniref:Glycosyl transferase, UDP-glucuronosyltransferase n=1 Tax=Saccharomonospora marina XMU15 TaxID=882083 RepID=H5XBY1_9PSEU|nr:nucleotide disphospho-sugar-binding domain-containing protein [Saccharomonospora marina]EHR52768.1 glycosyl transferase, UDP-glucuronosyltransferase [Saccharomonospora marina XMU15]